MRLAVHIVSCAVLVASVSLSGQEDWRTKQLWGERIGPFSRTIVRDAPFSAIASTVVIKTNRDGTRERLKATTRLYRDSNGRVRVDYETPAALRGQTNAATPMQKMAMLMVEDGPDSDDKPYVYSLDPGRRTFRVLSSRTAAGLFNAEMQFGIPVGVIAYGAPRFTNFVTADVHTSDGATRESLGRAQIEGVEVIGWRVTGAWPIFCKLCEGPGVQTDERWESPDLQVVVLARHFDRGDAVIDYPGKGVDIEYRLTNIVRREPPSELFTVPQSYVRHWGGPGDFDIAMGP